MKMDANYFTSKCWNICMVLWWHLLYGEKDSGVILKNKDSGLILTASMLQTYKWMGKIHSAIPCVKHDEQSRGEKNEWHIWCMAEKNVW